MRLEASASLPRIAASVTASTGGVWIRVKLCSRVSAPASLPSVSNSAIQTEAAELGQKAKYADWEVPAMGQLPPDPSPFPKALRRGRDPSHSETKVDRRAAQIDIYGLHTQTIQRKRDCVRPATQLCPSAGGVLRSRSLSVEIAGWKPISRFASPAVLPLFSTRRRNLDWPPIPGTLMAVGLLRQTAGITSSTEVEEPAGSGSSS